MRGEHKWLSGFDRALVLCPHTDDEFGCAGTISRLVEAGVEVKYVALSRCEESVPEGFPKDVLEKECRACTSVLGIKETNVDVLRFPVRRFPEHRQEILEHFYKLNQEYKPNLVMLPASFDNHQDHATVHSEGFRAFKCSTLIGYELPQNVTSFENSAFVCLTEEQMAKKIEALNCYESQRFRPYAAPDYMRGLGQVRGVQCNARFAEAFEAVRVIFR